MTAVYLIFLKLAELHTSLTCTLAEYGNKLFAVSSKSSISTPTTSCTVQIPNGPYFVSIYKGDIYQAYRLYSDYEGAFMEGTITNADGNFSTLAASIPVSSLDSS